MAAAQLTAQHMFRAELRRAQRDDVYFRTTIAIGTRSAVPAQVVNISPYGFMTRLREEVRQGDEVSLVFPGHEPRVATLVWALGGRAGGEFHEPIGIDEYRAILNAIAASPSSWELS